MAHRPLALVVAVACALGLHRSVPAAEGAAQPPASLDGAWRVEGKETPERTSREPIAASPLPMAVPAVPRHGEALQGCWQNETAENHLLWFLPHKCIQVAGPIGGGANPQADPVTYEEDKVVMGFPESQRLWKVQMQDGRLVLSSEKKTFRFRNLKDVPERLACHLRPLSLPTKAPELSAQRIQEIQAEVTRRHRLDQDARSEFRAASDSKDALEKMNRIDAENRASLRGLIEQVGWLDVGRFGYGTSYKAVIMLMHYPFDWPLMMAAVPEIERDVRAGAFEGRLFIGLHQRARRALGEPDRYGVVMWNPETNKPEVGPLEDPQRVNEFRRQISLPTLEEDLDRESKRTMPESIQNRLRKR
jgi:hypothetical protein